MTAEVLGSDGRLKDRQGLPPQGVSVGVYLNATVAFANGAPCIFNSKLWDPFGWFDTTTGAFTPKIAGYYRFSFRVRDNTQPAGGWSRAQAQKNGVSFCDGDFQLGNPGASQGDGIVFLNGSTDSLRVVMGRSDGGNYSAIGAAGAPDHSYLYAELVGTTAGVIPEPWHIVGNPGEPAFLNGWTNYTVGFQVARFCKDPLGWVHVEGFVRSGGASTNIFTLPVGYRPGASLRFPQSAGSAYGQIDVRSDGTLGHLVGSTGDFSINCNFRAEG